MRFFVPSDQRPDEKARWNKMLWAIGLGIFVGEAIFLLIYTAGEDFWQHYFTAQALIAGVPVETVQDIWPLQYVYPYLTFLPWALAPLSLLPPRLALTIWVASLYLAMGAAVYLLAMTLPHFTRSRAAAAALWFAIWPVTFVAVFMGQVSPFILLILVVAYRSDDGVGSSRPYSHIPFPTLAPDGEPCNLKRATAKQSIDSVIRGANP